MAGRIISRHLSRKRASARATALTAINRHRWYGAKPLKPGYYWIDRGRLTWHVVFTEDTEG